MRIVSGSSKMQGRADVANVPIVASGNIFFFVYLDASMLLFLFFCLYGVYVA